MGSGGVGSGERLFLRADEARAWSPCASSPVCLATKRLALHTCNTPPVPPVQFYLLPPHFSPALFCAHPPHPILSPTFISFLPVTWPQPIFPFSSYIMWGEGGNGVSAYTAAEAGQARLLVLLPSVFLVRRRKSG